MSKPLPLIFSKQGKQGECLINHAYTSLSTHKTRQLLIFNTDCILVCLFSVDKDGQRFLNVRGNKEKEALCDFKKESVTATSREVDGRDRKAQKQSDRQAGSCRLSPILTTYAHMLKPQHLSPLVFIHLELQPPWGLGMGAVVQSVPTVIIIRMNCCIMKISHLTLTCFRWVH